MRVFLIVGMAIATTGCSSGLKIDWAGTAAGVMQGVCRQSSRCDVPACDPGAPDRGVCDNPYRRGRNSGPLEPRPVIIKS